MSADKYPCIFLGQMAAIVCLTPLINIWINKYSNNISVDSGSIVTQLCCVCQLTDLCIDRKISRLSIKMLLECLLNQGGASEVFTEGNEYQSSVDQRSIKVID